ncbi:MAG: CBS domain-containing protein [Myxococcota bacterium]
MLPTVRTFMDTDTHALAEGDNIYEAVRELIDSGVTGAPVVDDRGKLVGMLSEYECLRLLTQGNADGVRPGGSDTVAAFMLREFKTVTPDMDVYFVAGLFLSDPGNRRLAVVEGDRLVAVITRKDILRAVEPRLRR